MEEAYSELYQQFLQLRSLCLKQAALLHHLAKALQEQKRHDGDIPVLLVMMFAILLTTETRCLQIPPRKFLSIDRKSLGHPRVN